VPVPTKYTGETCQPCLQQNNVSEGTCRSPADPASLTCPLMACLVNLRFLMMTWLLCLHLFTVVRDASSCVDSLSDLQKGLESGQSYVSALGTARGHCS
jgi:hypothetical protein